MAKDEKTQADALSVVLSLQCFSSFHSRAMAEESGFALLKRILLSPECKIGYHTLKVLVLFMVRFRRCFVWKNAFRVDLQSSWVGLDLRLVQF